MKLIEVIVAIRVNNSVLLFDIGCYFLQKIFTSTEKRREQIESKYEFKTISTDQFELHYDKQDGDFIEHKVIPFKRTVEMAKNCSH